MSSSKSQVFFTADLHFGHANAIKYSNRPFNSVEEMDRGLITNWNSVVSPQDETYIVGDFSFLNLEKTVGIIKQLNGNKHLIIGNHDKKIIRPELMYFLSSDPVHYKEIKIENQPIILCHYPFESWNLSHYGSWHLHGHCHGTLKRTVKNRLDVGTDCFGWKPVSFQTLKKVMEA